MHSRKDFGIASLWLDPPLPGWTNPYFVWYETAKQRDQAFITKTRNKTYQFKTYWRVDRADIDAIRAGSSNI